MTKKPDPVDMSAAAVTARLQEVGALYKLWLSLQTVRLDEAKTVAQVEAEQRQAPLATTGGVGKR